MIFLLEILAIFGIIFLLKTLFKGRKVEREDPAVQLARLEKEGRLSRQAFRATRAFAVEEFEDEGSQYFIELEGGEVLFLCGQYLYEYEVEDPEEGIPDRRFPCTEFEILRHRDEGYVLDILCAGRVLEPELCAPPFSMGEFKRNSVPEDGEIMSDRSYEALKRERLERPGR